MNEGVLGSFIFAVLGTSYRWSLLQVGLVHNARSYLKMVGRDGAQLFYALLGTFMAGGILHLIA